ncbi:SRPBCC domain-containing protein [uncultured Nitratireductor sp.]|uniref:SRPBCC domain-containing protein n=1 Tax=uncultured Nitratireductor sp. TaxID=520953 RepID=UPI0026235161|nr:SRPBCC domain-containing protein [uncultured Nitratireductor sp.]
MKHADMDAYGVVEAPNVVRFERLLPGPAERMWSYLTEADKRCQWLAGGAMEERVGGAAQLVFRHADFTDETPPDQYREMNENGFVSEGRILEWDPPRVLAMTWPGEGEGSEVRSSCSRKATGFFWWSRIAALPVVARWLTCPAAGMRIWRCSTRFFRAGPCRPSGRASRRWKPNTNSASRRHKSLFVQRREKEETS